jgi:hypothetical protein
MRPACDTLYDDIEGFGKRGKASPPQRYALDTKLTLRDVCEVKIFIVGDPVGRVRASGHEQASCTFRTDV